MANPEARAWWADVQHLRDDYERTDEARRRADQHDLASRRAAREGGRVAASGGQARSAQRGEPAAVVARAPEAPRASRRGEHGDGSLPAESHGEPHGQGAETTGRQTIEIRGRTVPAPALPRAIQAERQVERRRSSRTVARLGARPDRVAMWALLMGLALILVAIGTADTPAFVALTLR